LLHSEKAKKVIMIETTISALPPKVFISYSHIDRDFVSKLAKELLKHRIIVWWDEWEIKVGDSLIAKIEDGITGSAYLVVVLSPTSVNSSWVKEELNSAIIRQLEEKRTFVLPLLLNDCKIPLFLKEKKYADFRENFQKGLNDLISAIKTVDIRNIGRSDDGKFHNDYVFEWGKFRNNYGFKMTITSHGEGFPYSINCKIQAVANRILSDRLQNIENAGFQWATFEILLMHLVNSISKETSIILIEGNMENSQQYHFIDQKLGMGVKMDVKARRLGKDTGSDILFEWGSVFKNVAKEHIEGIHSSLTSEEIDKYGLWIILNPIHQLKKNH
jgi:hypothetical protein